MCNAFISIVFFQIPQPGYHYYHHYYFKIRNRNNSNLIDDFFFVWPLLLGFVAQFGINGDPKKMDFWRDKKLKDDPVKVIHDDSVSLQYRLSAMHQL